MKQFWLITGTMSVNVAVVYRLRRKKKRERERLIENKADAAEPIIFYSLHK